MPFFKSRKQQEVESLHEKVKAMEEDRDFWRKTCGKEIKQNIDARNRIDNLRQVVRDERDLNAKVGLQLIEKDRRYKRLLRKFGQAKANRNFWMDRTGVERRQKETFKERLVDLEANEEEQEKKLQNYKDAINRLTSKINRYTLKLSNIQRRHTRLLRMYGAVRNEVNDLHDKRFELREKLFQFAEDNEKLRRKYKRLLRMYGVARRETKEYKDIAQMNRNDAIRFLKEGQNLWHVFDRRRRKYKKLLRMFGWTKANESRLRWQRDAYFKWANEYAQRILCLESQLDDYKEKLEEERAKRQSYEQWIVDKSRYL